MNELEERARALLTAAADTIDVAPGVASAVRRAPVWPWLAAAAAVVLIAVGLPILLSGADRGVPPRPVAPADWLTFPSASTNWKWPIPRAVCAGENRSK